MDFAKPLIRAELLRRYKRFLADVRFADGAAATAHCPNPGSMLGLTEPGSEVWLSESDDAARKLRFGLELVRAGGSLVGVNTGRANAIVAEALAAGRVAQLRGYTQVRREVAMGTNSRVDFLLEGPGLPICYLEVKSVTLRRDSGGPGTAEFPDVVTARGSRHLCELARLAGQGHQAVLLYLVQRGDCTKFRLAADIDPAYARAAADAAQAGVTTLCYTCSVSPDGIGLERPLEIV